LADRIAGIVGMAGGAGSAEDIRADAEGSTILFVGDGAGLHRAALEEAFGDGSVAAESARAGESAAAALLWLANMHPEMGLVNDPGAWEPDYVRASGAERIAARAAAGADGT
jgi:hypothetical protein